MRLDPARSLTAAEQFCCLRSNPISCGRGELRPGRLKWRFDTRPTPVSRVYTLDLQYRQGYAPRITVISPDLVALASGRKIPHVYRQMPHAVELCVYLPRTREWISTMRLDRTMVPWAVVWLFYFEEWLASNEWKGGGEHPGNTHGRH
jgi:hypothetical protein